MFFFFNWSLINQCLITKQMTWLKRVNLHVNLVALMLCFMVYGVQKDLKKNKKRKKES